MSAERVAAEPGAEHAGATGHRVGDHHLAADARLLAGEIRQGILSSAVVHLPGTGRGFAYEVDGLGHALLMDDARPGGFVFIDEPFAHLDVANIDRVGTFLRATRAQYLITTPVTHNANVFAPAQLTLVTRKKKPGDDWAPTIGVLSRHLE